MKCASIICVSFPFSRLEKLGLFEESSKLLDDWYTTCFAGIICETVLMKVWDKVCGGAKKIVVFLFIELVKDMRSEILDLIFQDQLKKLVETVSKQVMYLNFLQLAVFLSLAGKGLGWSHCKEGYKVLAQQ